MEVLPAKRPIWKGYLAAILATSSILLILKSLQPIFGGPSPLLLFLVATVFAAWYGGFGAGCFATVLSVLASVCFLEEPYGFVAIAGPGGWLRIGLLIGVGTILSGVISALWRAEQQAWRAKLERRAAERRLGESEQRYRELFENSSDAIFLVDVTSDGRFKFAEVNPAEERLTGLSSAEAAGRLTEEVVPEALIERVNANFRRCVEAGMPISFEEVLEFPPGTRHLDTTLIPVRNAAGAIYRIVGIVRDITERRRVEELLREQVAQEERLAKIAAHAPGVMCNFRMRPDGSACIPYAAPGIVELYGFSPEELAGDASMVLPLIHPDDIERVTRSIAESAHTLSPWHEEYRVRHPVKGEIWIEGRSTPQADADGGITWYGFLHDVTERKRSQEQLALVSFALNHVREAAYLVDEQARLRYVNDESCRALGYSRGELLRLGVSAVDPGWPMDRWAEHWRDLKAHGSLTFESSHRTKDGHSFPVEINANYFEYEGRGYNLGLARDITERKRTEETLRQSQADLEMALNAARLGTWRWDIRTGEVDWSPQCKALYGLPADADISYERFLRAVHPDDRERVEAALRDTAETGSEYRLEKRILWPDGTEHWTASLGRCFLDETGRPVRVAGMSMDITERKLAEHELRTSEARFRTFVDHATDAFFLHDDRGTVVDVNRQACESLGYTREELIGMAPSEFDAGVDQSFIEGVNSRLAAGEIFAFDSLHRRKDGTVFPVEIRVRPFWQDGRRFGVALVRDITERKQAEETLREADRRKNEFLAMLGHELRNPLAPIRNATQIMRKLEMSDSRLQWVRDVVDRQVTHLARLVDDLLDVSRIVQGKLMLQKAPIDLSPVIDRAIEISRPLIEARHHTLNVSMPHEPVPVDGDGVRLIQVVSNLLDNAAKYTPEGGRIWLVVARRNGEAVISVRDTGEGISSALLPCLFDVFTQGERTLDRAQGGLGLGLTIVQNIVTQHGGKIEVRSEGHGQGSEFVVSLPMILDEPESVRSVAAF
jgi:PAS domain S-box-containing protein